MSQETENGASASVLEHIGPLFGMSDEERVKILDDQIKVWQHDLYLAQQLHCILVEVPDEILDPAEVANKADHARSIKRMEAGLVIMQRQRSAVKSGG